MGRLPGGYTGGPFSNQAAQKQRQQFELEVNARLVSPIPYLGVTYEGTPQSSPAPSRRHSTGSVRFDDGFDTSAFPSAGKPKPSTTARGRPAGTGKPTVSRSRAKSLTRSARPPPASKPTNQTGSRYRDHVKRSTQTPSGRSGWVRRSRGKFSAANAEAGWVRTK